MNISCMEDTPNPKGPEVKTMTQDNDIFVASSRCESSAACCLKLKENLKYCFNEQRCCYCLLRDIYCFKKTSAGRQYCVTRNLLEFCCCRCCDHVEPDHQVCCDDEHCCFCLSAERYCCRPHYAPGSRPAKGLCCTCEELKEGCC